MKETQDYWTSRLNEWAELDHVSRISEALFGLIMVLTFTCTLSVTNSGKQEVDKMLWAALGCNFAWGLVDAIMYLLTEVINRAYKSKVINRIKRTNDPAEARKMIRENITPMVAEFISDDEIDRMKEKVMEVPDIKIHRFLVFRNYMNALQIFFLVFIATFPVAIPYLVLDDVITAIRVSHGIALLLLFTGGILLARYAGLRALPTALAMTAIGVILVTLTIILGG